MTPARTIFFPIKQLTGWDRFFVAILTRQAGARYIARRMLRTIWRDNAKMGIDAELIFRMPSGESWRIVDPAGNVEPSPCPAVGVMGF